jgi:hypothetical protein
MGGMRSAHATKLTVESSEPSEMMVGVDAVFFLWRAPIGIA